MASYLQVAQRYFEQTLDTAMNLASSEFAKEFNGCHAIRFSLTNKCFSIALSFFELTQEAIQRELTKENNDGGFTANPKRC